MDPARQGWMGLALFIGGLVLVSAGGWRFETEAFTGRGALLALGYGIALSGIANIIIAAARSDQR